MSLASSATPYPVQLDFRGTLTIARWRPLVQWFLAIPPLFTPSALTLVRIVLTVVSLVPVVSPRRFPLLVFGATAMPLRYEGRAATSALSRRRESPPFDFQPAAT